MAAARKIDATSDEAAWDWVALAASTDKDAPSLMNVTVSQAGRVLVATDRNRLHIAVLDEAVSLPDGIYAADTRWAWDGTYPAWRGVLTAALGCDRADYIIEGDGILRALCEGLGKTFQSSRGMAGFVSVPGTSEPVVLNPRFTVEAMGAIEPTYAGLYAAGKHDPVILADSNWRRIAVVMPVRAQLLAPAYDLAPMLTPVSGPRAELPQPLRDSEPLTVVGEAIANA